MIIDDPQGDSLTLHIDRMSELRKMVDNLNHLVYLHEETEILIMLSTVWNAALIHLLSQKSEGVSDVVNGHSQAKFREALEFVRSFDTSLDHVEGLSYHLVSKDSTAQTPPTKLDKSNRRTEVLKGVRLQYRGYCKEALDHVRGSTFRWNTELLRILPDEGCTMFMLKATVEEWGLALNGALERGTKAMLRHITLTGKILQDLYYAPACKRDHVSGGALNDGLFRDDYQTYIVPRESMMYDNAGALNTEYDLPGFQSTADVERKLAYAQLTMNGNIPGGRVLQEILDTSRRRVDEAKLLKESGFISWDEVETVIRENREKVIVCLLYTSPSPRDQRGSRMPSSA